MSLSPSNGFPRVGGPLSTFEDLTSLEQLGWSPRWAALAAALPSEPELRCARVIAQHRGRWTVASPEGFVMADLPGRFRTGDHLGVPAVGDWVRYRPRADGGSIVDVLERQSTLTRIVAGGTTEAQVIAANIERVFIIVALDVEPNARRIERQISTVWESGATPVIVATKTDLSTNLAEAEATIRALSIGLDCLLTSSATGEGIDAVQRLCTPGTTVALLGTSGAGKSTLANRLIGSEVMAVQAVDALGKGRHTTTHRQLLILPTGALLIDTPGMRELGLWVAPGESGVSETFSDVEAVAASCRFSNCGHQGDRGCAVDAAIADGSLDADRVESWKHLGRELAWVERRHDARAAAEHKKMWAARAKAAKDRTRT